MRRVCGHGHEQASQVMLAGAAVRRIGGALEEARQGETRDDGATEEGGGLRERSLDDLMQSFGRFARTQPATFFGGAVVAGFALSRFLKSSADAPSRGTGQHHL
jgi:hypothetical protein